MIAQGTMYAVTVDKKIVYKGSKTDMQRLAKRFTKSTSYIVKAVQCHSAMQVGDMVSSIRLL
jgi:hypothetical protein